MGLADARAIYPHLLAQWAEPDKDIARLQDLAKWCTRYTPWTNIEGKDGIWLDVSGCTHLFGGEASLCRDILKHLNRLQITARIGLADTAGAAWALSHFGKKPFNIADINQISQALAPLPPESLRLNEDIALLLRRFGLKSCGDLFDLPRAAVARRFSHKDLGEAVLKRLDQALGKEEEPITPISPSPHYRTKINLPEPISTREAIENCLSSLSASLITILNEDQLGARALSFHCFRVDGTTTRISISLSAPSRSLPHMERLFAEKLQLIDPGFGIEMLCLNADTTEPLTATQSNLHEDIHTDWAHKRLDELIDRYKNRFGPANIRQLYSHHSHIPERAAGLREHGHRTEGSTPHINRRPRPLILFSKAEEAKATAEIPNAPPVQFQWRFGHHLIKRAQGPERISLEWWRHPLGQEHEARDYYHLEDSEGRRFWLYRDGLYRNMKKGTSLRWYVQGLFP